MRTLALRLDFDHFVLVAGLLHHPALVVILKEYIKSFLSRLSEYCKVAILTVLPSVPHTGSYSDGHSVGHLH